MRWLKRLGIGFVVLVVVAALLWTVSRLRGPTPEQRAALEVMRTPNAFAGRNAFDAAWLLTYDVPDADIASVANADIAAVAATPLSRPIEGTSSAHGRYADLRPDRNAPLEPCPISGDACLMLVRGDPEGYAGLVETHRPLIDRVEALAKYDHPAMRMPARVDTPLPPFQPLAWPLTAHAVEFVAGDALLAVGSACRDLSTMRRLGSNTDLLIARMFMSRLATEGYGRLLADMLAELPAGAPLPDICKEALAAPSDEESSVCPALRGEFAWVHQGAGQIVLEQATARMQWLVFDPDGYAAMAAQRIGQGCMDAAVEARRLDLRFVSEATRPFHSRLACIANSAGCILGDIAGPAYDGYIHAGQDHHARLQLIGTLAWLRAQPAEGALSERLARRPEGLRSPVRDITVSADGRALQIAQ